MELQRVAWLAGFGLGVFACGERFTPVDPNAAGAGGRSAAGTGNTVAGSAIGGDDTTDGGADSGGSAKGGRAGGGSTAGGGGKLPSAGTGGVGASGDPGDGGSGGSVDVQVPPVPLEGLELWFDASAGITQATSGVVSVWKDQSGNGRDALQTALNYRPKLSASLNGKRALVFDGEDDYLKLPTLPGDFSHGVSIFTVAQQATDDGSCTAFFEASNGAEVDDIHLGTWESALQYEVLTEYLHPAEQKLLLGAPQLLAVVHQTSERTQLRRNSSALGESTFPLPAVTARNEVFIGRSAYSGCKPYNGSIGELLVYSRAVSDPELIEIETYLQAKWGCCQE